MNDTFSSKTRVAVDEPEDVLYETGLATIDAGCSTGLTEVLARKSSGHQFHVARQRCEVRDVAFIWNSGELPYKHCGSRSPVLRKNNGLVPGLMKTEFKTSDSGK
jgi:hypothetical protein